MGIGPLGNRLTLLSRMSTNYLRAFYATAFCLVVPFLAQSQELKVAPGNTSGVYKTGEQIHWNIEVKGDEFSEAAYLIKKGGMTEISKGTVVLKDGKGEIQSKLEEPGWMLAEVSIQSGTNKPVKAIGGAITSPEKIQPALLRPDDFDAFWEAKLTELKAVPMNAEIVRGESNKPGVEYNAITMDNIRGSHIRGQIARPEKGEKFPAMLIVQWAGVYPLQKSWVMDRAAEGWLVLNINAHDLPIDKPAEFYNEQNSGPLKDYPAIGNDDRETSYFLRMYLSCYRGTQYLVERPDWDGRTLVVTGGSQGGMQSIVTAALHPRITAVMACVPAGCDLSGPEAKRLPGWPMWYYKTQGKDEAKVRAAARYFDVVNFASRVKVPVLVGAGLIDTVCPTPGVMAACNQLKGPKEILILPLSEHGDKNGSQSRYYERFNAWKEALAKGGSAPVPVSN